MDVSLDTDITIHLYNAGKEQLLYKYFDKLYIHEFVLEREVRNKSRAVYEIIKKEVQSGKIIIVTQKYLLDIGMRKNYENWLYDMRTLFDYGEANAVALAGTLGIAALVTDDTKDYGPHETLLKELIEDIIPFAFYELLYLDYLQSDDAFEIFKNDYDKINQTAYPKHPMDFISRIKRVVRRFSRHGTKRDRAWMDNFCQMNAIDYRQKMQALLRHLQEEEAKKSG